MKGTILGIATITFTLMLLVCLAPSGQAAMMRYEFSGTFTDGEINLSVHSELPGPDYLDWYEPYLLLIGKDFQGYFEYDPSSYCEDCGGWGQDYALGDTGIQIEGITFGSSDVKGVYRVGDALMYDEYNPYSLHYSGFGVRFDLISNVDPMATIGKSEIVGAEGGFEGHYDDMLAVIIDWNVRGDVTSLNVVPEPATMLLLGSGLIGLAGFRKKFKK